MRAFTRWCILMITCFVTLFSGKVQANTIAKVGASHEASTLLVFIAISFEEEQNECFKKVLGADIQEFEDTTKRTVPSVKDTIRTLNAVLIPDTTLSPIDTARIKQLTDSVTDPKFINKSVKGLKTQFVPNPIRALWLSLVFPGAGQIYNRKYWKLPFVYGGFIGCTYALMWNQMMYRDYSQAYLDIMDDDPNTKSYMEMLPPRYDITGREEQFKSIFKRKKDYYRRYRDLSAFCFVGVYLLSVIDAYVDAQLSVFDITPDLSMSVEPAVLGTPSVTGKRGGSAYGVGCSFRF